MPDRTYVVQSFQSPTRAQGARPNKARDEVAYAVTALFTMSIDDIPNRIREQVIEAREAIRADLIKNIHIWFIHNCPETDECKRIMDGVAAQAISILRGQQKSNIVVDASEVGLETLDQL